MTTNCNTLPTVSIKPRSFLLRLFASRSRGRYSAISQAVATADHASESSQGNATSKKVLIVDDDAVILKTTSLKLKARGFAVVTATDGPSAIGVIRRERPDLILLDISLPPNVGAVAWDGLLLMAWLRRLEEARHIPIIVITGGDPMAYKNRSLEAGATAFFHKPIDHTDLLAVIDRAISSDAEARQEVTTPNFQI